MFNPDPNKFSDLEVHQYVDYPEIPRKSKMATILGRIEMDTVEAKLHPVAIMLHHGEEATPESEAEMLRMAHLFKAGPRMYEALTLAKNRMETIQETHPEIHLASEIILAIGAIWDANNEQRSFRDAIKISRARGDWTPEMTKEWADSMDEGPTKLPEINS